MVLLLSEPVQGRDNTQQVRPSGNTSISFVIPPQGIRPDDVIIPPIDITINWINGVNDVVNGVDRLVFTKNV